MRKILLMVAVAALAGLVMFAQDKGGGKGPGGGKAKAPPKNLKVFTQENWTTVGRPMMDVFVTSLGLADKGGCTYCHIGPGQFDDDAKPPKNVARMMIGMTNDINAKFPDGRQHVTCYTCHRGSTSPLTTAP
jgi:photosynthetic reaction center cytochrome c subunit